MSDPSPEGVAARREVKQQTATLKAQEKEAKVGSRSAKESKPGEAKRLTDRLITLIELGGVALVVHLLRKPLEHFALKVAKDIYKGIHVVEDGLKDLAKGIEATELTVRADIRARYFEDPILMHKLGPGLYTQLIANANWDTTIHHPDGSYPGEVADLFIAGTGRGATQLRGALAHGVSVQVLALTKWFIGNSANLQEIGRFPQAVVA